MISPTIIISLQWLILIAAYHATSMASHQPINLIFYLILLIFVTFMAIGELTGRAAPKLQPLNIKIINKEITYMIGALLFTISLAIAYSTISKNTFTSALEFRDSLFYTSNGEDRASFGVGLAFPIAAAAYLIAKSEGDRKTKYTFMAAMIILAVLSTSKMYLFLFIFFLMPETKKLRIKHTIIAVSALTLMFAASHIVLQKFSSDPGEGLIQALLKTLEVYLLSGIAAFQKVLEGTAYLPELRSLYGLNQILPLDIHGVPDSNILEFTTIESGWQTNVYTAMGVWWNDFGYTGVAIISTFIGFAYQKIWEGRSLQSKYLTAFSLFPLLFTFFDDYFLMSLKMWVAFILGALLIALTKLNQKQVRTSN